MASTTHASTRAMSAPPCGRSSSRRARPTWSWWIRRGRVCRRRSCGECSRSRPAGSSTSPATPPPSRRTRARWWTPATSFAACTRWTCSRRRRTSSPSRSSPVRFDASWTLLSTGQMGQRINRAVVALTALAAAASFGAPAALAAPGDADPTFSGDGRQLTDFGGNVDSGGAVAVQADGKLVVAGSSRQGAAADFALARYNADGTLDSSFSGDGRQTTDFGAADFASGVAVQPDGKIVAAGFSQQGVAPFLVFAVARYNADGTPDNSFSGDGRQTTDFGTGGGASAAAVAIQPDGRIGLGGNSSGLGGANVDFAAARYDSAGAPDNSFSGDGKETIDFGGREDNGAAVDVQPDGKIVIAGTSSAGNADFAALRFNSDGTLDSSFSGDGRQLTDFGGLQDTVGGMALEPNGKIVISGSSDITPSSGFALARYNSDGTPDVSFSGDGRQTADFGGGAGPSVAVQRDGRIVLAGLSSPGNFALARFNANGPLDGSFSGDGRQTMDFSGR